MEDGGGITIHPIFEEGWEKGGGLVGRGGRISREGKWNARGGGGRADTEVGKGRTGDG